MGKKFVVVDKVELDEFVDRFSGATQTSSAIKSILEQVASKYLNDLIQRTPVNKDLTAPTRGNLKKQWSIDNSNLFTQITETANGFYIELVNTTPYASWVEKGHRKVVFGHDTGGWVMGRFYVKKTEVLYQQGKLDSLVEKQFTTWLKNTIEGGG